MEYILWVNKYFLTIVKATSMKEAKRNIKNMTTDESMFEWVSAFDTPYEEGDIPISDIPSYPECKFISYDKLHDIIKEYDWLYIEYLNQREQIGYYTEQIELGYDEYKDALEMSEYMIRDIHIMMEKLYWMLHKKY